MPRKRKLLVIDSLLPTYPLLAHLLTFLPLEIPIRAWRSSSQSPLRLDSIVQAFDATPTPILLLISASPSEDTTEAFRQDKVSPIILGVFSTCCLGPESDDKRSMYKTWGMLDSKTQIFQLQPTHRVFTALPKNITLSYDSMSPERRGVALDGSMIGGIHGYSEKTTLMLKGKGRESFLRRAGSDLRFSIDEWWILEDDDKIGDTLMLKCECYGRSIERDTRE